MPWNSADFAQGQAEFRYSRAHIQDRSNNNRAQLTSEQSSDIAGLIYRTGVTTTELNVLQSRVQMGRAKSLH
jgi:hypothetical protein